ncbi:MAG TPA: phosphate ABC transporter substrate-binding protein [Duganella sp.]|uniref:phosphate ABC transporter substrate-binding protein n=1 Tax=Duganella sp. TaxID=1904440 RepID=UPI002ED5003C
MTDRLLPLPVRRRLSASLLIVSAWLAAGGAASADDGARDPVIVVSAKNPLSSLRHEQVAAIFLAQSERFPDGAEAVPLDLPPGSAPRDAFYQRVAAMSPAQMKAYWTKMVFTGRAQPPRELRTSAAVRRMVADNPAMIGYIERAALDASVKVLEVGP